MQQALIFVTVFKSVVCLRLQQPTRIKHSELTNVEPIAEGGFGVIYRAVHHEWGTVVYKELKSTFIKDGSKFVLFYFCSFSAML